MNLQENIHRLQSMMGIINEDDKSAKIIKMIEDMGLMTTIKFFGDYDTVKKHLGGGITREYQIQFIEDAVQHLSNPHNSTGISIYELGLNAIPFGTSDDDEQQQIEYFGPGFVTIDVYGDGYHKSSFTENYENLDDYTLNDVFLFMVDALKHY
jgi:hypothetical protein